MSRSWLTLDTWITSDQHWSHHNIRKYQGRPENHFELMMIKWNSVVKPTDTILCLGDLVCYGDIDNHPWWLNGLNGEKYLLKGNHDKHSYQWYKNAGFEVVGRKPFLWHTERDGEPYIVCFSHEPDTPNGFHNPFMGGWDINIHGHIHGNPYFGTTPQWNYVNVSVEVTDYAPARLRDVIDGKAGCHRSAVVGIDTNFR